MHRMVELQCSKVISDCVLNIRVCMMVARYTLVLSDGHIVPSDGYLSRYENIRGWSSLILQEGGGRERPFNIRLVCFFVGFSLSCFAGFC